MGIPSSQYHDQTSYARHKPSGHYLDWDNQPSITKTYPGITPVRLTENPLLPQVSLSQILKEQKAPQINALSTLEDLSQIFGLTYSLTAKTAGSGRVFYYRSVASAGALYPIEMYLATPKIQGLNEGLYHYSIGLPGLSPLREGNFSHFLRSAGQWPEGFQPGVVFLFTAIFFRSAWKYRDRAFRYHLLDAGHLIENLLLALRAKNLPLALTYDFDDPAINRFLGLDTNR
ncbi:MAG: SagB/ThcOx family dehydrogenase, partial [Thermodesulfobacteriota bacterium]